MSSCIKCYIITPNTSTVVTILTLLKSTHKIFTEYYIKKGKRSLPIIKKVGLLVEF